MTDVEVVPVSNEPEKLPVWMTNLSAEGVTVTLAVPTEINGIKVDTLVLRSPRLKDVRASQKTHPNDDQAADLMLFASLAGVSAADVENLKLVDYYRVRTSYFRMVADDPV